MTPQLDCFKFSKFSKKNQNFKKNSKFSCFSQVQPLSRHFLIDTSAPGAGGPDGPGGLAGRDYTSGKRFFSSFLK